MPSATYHPSVMRRFKEASVLICDRETPYRPDLIEKHLDFADFYRAERDLRNAGAVGKESA